MSELAGTPHLSESIYFVINILFYTKHREEVKLWASVSGEETDALIFLGVYL